MLGDSDHKLGWWGLHGLQLLGCVLTTFSILILVVLVWLGAEEQPSRSEVALMTFLSACFQLVAAWVFSRVRRIDKTHASASTRRLYRLAQRAENTTDLAERARSKEMPASDVRQAISLLSVELSVLQEGLVDAAEDWTEALPDSKA